MRPHRDNYAFIGPFHAELSLRRSPDDSHERFAAHASTFRSPGGEPGLRGFLDGGALCLMVQGAPCAMHS